MAIDEKAAFFWRHRERIEEWSELANQARTAFFESLRSGLTDSLIEVDDPPWEWAEGLYSNGWCGIRLPLDEGRGVHVGVYWVPGDRSGRGYWPEFAVSAAVPDAFPDYWPLKARLGPVAAKYGMTGNAKGNFLWFGQIPLRSDLLIDKCAAATLATVRSAHRALLPETTGFFSAKG